MADLGAGGVEGLAWFHLAGDTTLDHIVGNRNVRNGVCVGGALCVCFFFL